MRFIILITLFLLSYSKVKADYGTLYYFKCHIVSSDTTMEGYVHVPQHIVEPLLNQYNSTEELFNSKIIPYLKSQEEIGSNDLVFIYDYTNRQTGLKINALYTSKHIKTVKTKNIKSVKYLDFIKYVFEPNHVYSFHTPEDLEWINDNVKELITLRIINDCGPEYFLIYDLNVEFEYVIADLVNARRKNDSQKVKQLLEELRKKKIVAISINETCM